MVYEEPEELLPPERARLRRAHTLHDPYRSPHGCHHEGRCGIPGCREAVAARREHSDIAVAAAMSALPWFHPEDMKHPAAKELPARASALSALLPLDPKLQRHSVNLRSKSELTDKPPLIPGRSPRRPSATFTIDRGIESAMMCQEAIFCEETNARTAPLASPPRVATQLVPSTEADDGGARQGDSRSTSSPRFDSSCKYVFRDNGKTKADSWPACNSDFDSVSEEEGSDGFHKTPVFGVSPPSDK